MSNFIYYEKLEDYEEQVRKAKLCDEKDKEIERLTKQNKALNEMYELTKKEYIRLNNVINELEKELDLNFLTANEQVFVEKINEIIDYINKEKDE